VTSKTYILVDSCVLLDIFNADDRWCDWSSSTLYLLSKKHQLAVNFIVFTEVAYNFDSTAELQDTLGSLNISVLNIPLEVAFGVSRTFKQYRLNKGNKKAPIPDFYIGEHAKFLDVPLVTRDFARYRTYQPTLKLITPEDIAH